MSEANKTQVGGGHYKKLVIQPWDYIIANDLDWCEGNIVKLVTRWRDKGGLQDLEKVKHFVDKLIENTKKEEPRAHVP